MAEIRTESVTLQVDETSMRCYVVTPQTAEPLAGLMLFQEAFGVNAHIRDVAERFAREGYKTIAPELYHRTAQRFEGAYNNFEAVKPHMGALTEEGMESDVRSTYSWLAENLGNSKTPIACVGFCLGGRVSFLANSAVPLKAAVSFYGGGIAPNAMTGGLLGRAGSLHATQLFFWGGLDKHIGPDQRRAVTDATDKAGKQYVNVEISDADHGFFCDARASFNAKAAHQAWALTNAFFDSHLKA